MNLENKGYSSVLDKTAWQPEEYISHLLMQITGESVAKLLQEHSAFNLPISISNRNLVHSTSPGLFGSAYAFAIALNCASLKFGPIALRPILNRFWVIEPCRKGSKSWKTIWCYYTTLHYTTLYYIILYYTISHYTILYYTILYYTILYYTILYYTILYYTILYYTILYYTIPYYTILYYTILH